MRTKRHAVHLLWTCGQAAHDLLVSMRLGGQADTASMLALLCTAWELWFSVFGFGPWFKLGFPFHLLRAHLHGIYLWRCVRSKWKGNPNLNHEPKPKTENYNSQAVQRSASTGAATSCPRCHTGTSTSAWSCATSRSKCSVAPEACLLVLNPGLT